MREGDVVLTPLPQADGQIKTRPALLLRRFPPFGDFLACGISTQIKLVVVGFDELIRSSDSDFSESGLIADSVIRLGYLAGLPRTRIAGVIGAVSSGRYERLVRRLSRHLLAGIQKRQRQS